jgi:hypothetical protein
MRLPSALTDRHHRDDRSDHDRKIAADLHVDGDGEAVQSSSAEWAVLRVPPRSRRTGARLTARRSPRLSQGMPPLMATSCSSGGSGLSVASMRA